MRKRVAGVAMMLGVSMVLLTGCATTGRSNAEVACATALLLGAVAGAVIDDEKGALIGLAVGGLGCAVYRYLNERQVAEMSDRTLELLAESDPEETIDEQFMLSAADGASRPVVSFSAGAAVEPSTLLDDQTIARAGGSDFVYCREASREVRPSLGATDALVDESVDCLKANGEFVTVSRRDAV